MRPHLPLAIATLLLAAAPAQAAPATPQLRIEGRTTTLFEGPLRADGHAVRAANDTRDRACGTAGPTPTSLAADGLRLAGLDFAGTWYAGYEDYLVTRFGPDSASSDAWSLRVDGTLTVRGGCQIALADGNEALWALSIAPNQPHLKLTGATAAAPNAPVAVTVRDYTGAPVAGATVAAVQTAGNGVQTPGATGPATDAAGTATLSFAAPGWHRVKATKAGAVRSNRLDVCVGECGAPPADAQIRDVVPVVVTPTPTATPTPNPQPAPQPQPQPFATPKLLLSGSRLQLRGIDPRQTSWTVTATPRGVKNAKPLTRTTATFTVPTGREYAFTFDATSLGTLIVPIDDRAKAIRYRGKTKRTSTHTRLSKNATATVRLGAGRPLLLLGPKSRGTIEVAGRRYKAKSIVRAATRSKTGTVRIKVRSGAIDLTGIAAGG